MQKEYCCKVGCNKEVIKKQKICFRNYDGYIVKVTIGWCKSCKPDYDLSEWENPDLLRHGGY